MTHDLSFAEKLQFTLERYFRFPGFTEQQIERLNTLSYSTQNIVQSPSQFIELTNMFGKELDKDKCISVLENMSSIKDIPFSGQLKKQTEEKVRREIDILKDDEEGIVALATCKCGSDEVAVTTKQTRSSDEPMTVFYRCVRCNTKWTS